MATTADAAQDVVAGYHAALARRDFDGAHGYLREDLRFEGPFDTFASATDYLAAIQGLWQIVESIDIKHRSGAGTEIVVLYDMVTRTPAGTQLICEWFGIEDGKIAWLRAVFDTAPFAALRS